MASRRTGCDGTEGDGGGLGGFLRTLLSGIPWSESATVEERLEFALPKRRIVEIQNANGKTAVVGEDRKDIEVLLRKSARAENEQAAERLLDTMKLSARESGGILELDVEIPRRWNRHGSVDLEVHVPQDVEIHVSSSNGRLCVQGLCRPVIARSSNGSVRMTNVKGDIDITTANAKVCCTSTCGKLIARSSNGKIEVVEHRGGIDLTTSNGLIRASLDGLDKDGVHLTTSNGRIVLELPEELDADVDIRVDNGVIRNELPVGPESGDDNGRLRCRLGRGGIPIKLRTSNGTINLR